MSAAVGARTGNLILAVALEWRTGHDRRMASQRRQAWLLAVLLGMPMLIGVVGMLGLFLALLAAGGYWGRFCGVLGVEAYAVLAIVVTVRSAKRRRREARATHHARS